MSKGNEITNEIERIYRRQAFHLLLYGFVQGVQWSTPSVTRGEAIQAFLKRFKIFNYSQSDAMTTYSRVDEDMRHAEKHDADKNK
jgi:hypothetical protein